MDTRAAPTQFLEFRHKLTAQHGARALDAVVLLGSCEACNSLATTGALGTNAQCGFPSIEQFLGTVSHIAESMTHHLAAKCERCGAFFIDFHVRYHAFHGGRGMDLVASIGRGQGATVELGWEDPQTHALEPLSSLDGEDARSFLQEAAFREVHAAFELKQVERAVALVDTLVKRFPADPGLLFFAGPLLARGYASFAGELAAAHVKAAPQDPEGHYWQGEVLFCSIMHGLEPTRRAGEALRSFEQALELDPTHARAQLSRCMILRAEGNVDAAIEAYERLLASNPELAEARYNLGAILLDRNAEHALRHFEQGEKLRPGDADFQIGCARALLKLDRKMEARWSLDRAKSLAPKHPRIPELDAALD